MSEWTVRAEKILGDPEPARTVISHEMTEAEAVEFFGKTVASFSPEWRVTVEGGRRAARGTAGPVEKGGSDGAR